MIEPQLRRQDRAAWRTQAFVLALTGDARGASQTAARMMPGGGRADGAVLRPAPVPQPGAEGAGGPFRHASRATAAPRRARTSTPAPIRARSRWPRNDVPRRRRLAPRAAERQPVPGPAPVAAASGRVARQPGAAQRLPRRRRRAAGSSPAGSHPPPAVRAAAGPSPSRQSPNRQAEPEPVARPNSGRRRAEPARCRAGDARDTRLADSLGRAGLFAHARQQRRRRARRPRRRRRPSRRRRRVASRDRRLDRARPIWRSVLQAALRDDGGGATPAPQPRRRRGAEPRQTRTAEARTADDRRRPAARRPAQPSRRWVQIADGRRTAPRCRANSPACATRAPEALRSRGAYTRAVRPLLSRLLVGPFDTRARRRRSSSTSSAAPTSRHLPGQARRARR